MKYDGPVVLVVMDGVGLSTRTEGNAVKQAHTEFLNRISREYLAVALQASGEAVGVLPGQMGNSEVGHNTLGSEQIVRQGIAQIKEALESGEIFASETWREAVRRGTEGTLHFAGIFSDGGVHSHIEHLEKMIARAYDEGVRRVRLHAIFDGRDVAPQSEPKYIRRIEKFAEGLKDLDFRIASGAGRMVAVADRYENDWGMVQTGWEMMVHGAAEREFGSAEEAVQTLRQEDTEVQDQYLPAFVVVEDGEPVGRVQDGDAFIYYDFRADRAIEIAMAFTYNDFPYFDRGERPEVYFVGMTEYNSDTYVPEHRLVSPVKIHGTLNEFLGERGLAQLAASETVKFGHITYYFNGNSYERAPREEFIEVPSDVLPFNTRPWMKAAEVTDAVLEEMAEYDFVRVNFPGGDMVGHFGELEPTVVAMEAIDLQLKRLAEKVDELGGMMIVTADHGNAEELVDAAGRPKTSHTTNLVPCIFYDNTENRGRYVAKSGEFGLANVAATVAMLLGCEDYPEAWRLPGWQSIMQ